MQPRFIPRVAPSPQLSLEPLPAPAPLSQAELPSLVPTELQEHVHEVDSEIFLKLR